MSSDEIIRLGPTLPAPPRRSKDIELRQLLQAIPHGIQENDLSGTITFSNAAHAKMHGYPADELLGKKIWDLLADEQEKAGLRDYLATLVAEQPDPTPLVARDRTKAGAIIFVEVDWTYKRDDTGRLVGFISVITDITERVVAERELREASERYRLLFEEAPVMYIITHNDGGVPVIKDCNKHVLHTLGYSRKEVVGLPLAELYTPESEYALFGEGGYARALRGELFSEVRQLFAKDGRVIETLLRAVPETDAKNAVIGTRAMYIDVTEQRRLQAQLSQTGKMEALGRLAGGIAHDFNNLLTVISGYTELQILKTEKGEEIGDLREIKRAADRGAELTRQLLAFTRQRESEVGLLDINDIVAEVEKLLCRTLGDDIELRSELNPSLSRVKANRGQIEQVLVNLAINARDAMPKGGKLTIETANRVLREEGALLSSNLSPGDYVMVAISDTGLGMNDEQLEKIFEPFFTTKKSGRGTGLGLSIVYGIVKQHSGHIEVRSKLGQGSRFEIFLPAFDEEDLPHPVEAASEVEIRDCRETILLVEDQLEVRQLLTRILEERGFKVLAAGKAARAQELYREFPDGIDLLLTDVQLPDSSGRELARQICALRPSKVLLISGHDPEMFSVGAARTSRHPFLRKPFDSITLIRKIRQVLDEPTDDPFD